MQGIVQIKEEMKCREIERNERKWWEFNKDCSGKEKPRQCKNSWKNNGKERKPKEKINYREIEKVMGVK